MKAWFKNSQAILEKPNIAKFEKSSIIVREADAHKPIAKALQTLDGQVDAQADQISEQLKILIDRAFQIKERRRVSEIVYSFQFGFQPIVQQVYYIYRAAGRMFVSIIGPTEWSTRRKVELTYTATVKLDYDHTWEVLALEEDIFSVSSQ